MSSLLDCCQSPNSTVPPVQIPGSQGPPGTPGTAGTNGLAAYTNTAADFVVPAVNANTAPPNIAVANTLWMAVGQIVIAGSAFGGVATGPATFQVFSIESATAFTGKFLGYPGDVAPGQTISSGALITAAGQRGAAGAAGAAGAVFPTTTKGDTMFDNGALAPAPSVIRLPIGSQGQALFADPSNATPASVIRWIGGSQVVNTNIVSAATGPDTTEDTLQSFSIPASTLRNNGDAIDWEAVFDVVATASVATKLVKAYFGATVVSQFGDAALDGGSIIMRGSIYRVSANSQISYATLYTTNSAATSTTKNNRSGPGETLANAILFKCTGQNGTNGVANGIIQQHLRINYRANA